jgi:hypothetical protein
MYRVMVMDAYCPRELSMFRVAWIYLVVVLRCIADFVCFALLAVVLSLPVIP